MKRLPLIIILVLNLLVYLGWRFAATEAEFVFMAKNFLVSWDAVMEGRFWTLLTSVFSHASFFHLLFNMLALSSFAGIMLQVLGVANFTVFYLLAGLAGSVAHITTSAFLMHDPGMNALGASGAVAGIVLLFSLIFPKEKLLIMGIIPVRAIWGAIALMGLDVWGLITQTQGGGFAIGHGAHLGGALVGIIYFLIFKSRRHLHQ
jgi:rhomboid-like protein